MYTRRRCTDTQQSSSGRSDPSRAGPRLVSGVYPQRAQPTDVLTYVRTVVDWREPITSTACNDLLEAAGAHERSAVAAVVVAVAWCSLLCYSLASRPSSNRPSPVSVSRGIRPCYAFRDGFLCSVSRAFQGYWPDWSPRIYTAPPSGRAGLIDRSARPYKHVNIPLLIGCLQTGRSLSYLLSSPFLSLFTIQLRIAASCPAAETDLFRWCINMRLAVSRSPAAAADVYDGNRRGGGGGRVQPNARPSSALSRLVSAVAARCQLAAVIAWLGLGISPRRMSIGHHFWHRRRRRCCNR